MNRTPLPARARHSLALWLVAIALGAAEALVRALLPDPPTPAQLAVRFATYAALVALVLALRTGRNAVRWTVAVLLGGVGTVSLVAEPVAWLLAGGSPLAFLAAADGPTLLLAALRLAHLVAVVAALVLLFHRTSDTFFRSRVLTRGAGIINS